MIQTSTSTGLFCTAARTLKRTPAHSPLLFFSNLQFVLHHHHKMHTTAPEGSPVSGIQEAGCWKRETAALASGTWIQAEYLPGHAGGLLPTEYLPGEAPLTGGNNFATSLAAYFLFSNPESCVSRRTTIRLALDQYTLDLPVCILIKWCLNWNSHATPAFIPDSPGWYCTYTAKGHFHFLPGSIPDSLHESTFSPRWFVPPSSIPSVPCHPDGICILPRKFCFHGRHEQRMGLRRKKSAKCLMGDHQYTTREFHVHFN